MSRSSIPAGRNLITPTRRVKPTAIGRTTLGEYHLTYLIPARQDRVAAISRDFRVLAPACPLASAIAACTVSRIDPDGTISLDFTFTSMPGKSSEMTRTSPNLPHAKKRPSVVGERSVDLRFAIGDNAQIDDSDITGTVVAVNIKAQGLLYQLEWFHNGGINSGWFDEFRLKEP